MGIQKSSGSSHKSVFLKAASTYDDDTTDQATGRVNGAEYLFIRACFH